MSCDVLSNLVITSVHSVSTMYTPENVKMKRNDRPRWAVVIKYEGETVYTCLGRKYLSDAGHLVILPRGCSYEWQCTKAGHFAIIEFESDLTHREPFGFVVKNSERILKMFRELEYKRNLKKPMVEVESIRDTYSVILALAQTEPEKYMPSEKQRKIAPAVEYISRNYHKNITNGELASLTGLSAVYFRKLFTDVMGISPIAYVHEIRIRKAKEMLKSDYGTLSDLALTLGYSSLFDFSRDFKKRTGISPSKYGTHNEKADPPAS